MVRLWNRYIAGLYGCYPITEQDMRDEVLSKTYFCPEGLIMAEEDGRLIGFAHAGFFAPDRINPDYSLGTICMLVLEEGEQGAGRELVRAGVNYLKERGAEVIRAFDIDHPRVPFYNGMYGGAETAGMDEAHPQARGLLETAGFAIEESAKIMTIDLKEKAPEFPFRDCEVTASSFPSVPEGRSFRDSYGLRDKMTRLEAKVGGQPAGSLITWRVERMEEVSGRRLAVATYVGVKEDYRGTGVAQALFRVLYDRLASEGVDVLGLGVTSDNARAIRFYEKVGMSILRGAHTYILKA